MHRSRAARDVHRVARTLTDPGKHRPRQSVRGCHAECPRLETPPRSTPDDLAEEDHVTGRTEPPPRVHADDAGDAHLVAGLLLDLACRCDRGVLAWFAVTAGKFPARGPGTELEEHPAALHDCNLGALDRPLDAVDHHRAHERRCSTFGSPMKSGSTPGTITWSKTSVAVPTVMALTMSTLPWVSGGGSSATSTATA